MTPRDAALAFAVTATWGGGLTLAKSTMERFPPVFLMAVSLAVTAAIIALASRRSPKTSHMRAALIALFAITLQSALIFKGLSGLRASTGGLLSQVQVPMALFAAWLLHTEPFDARKLVPVLISFVGVAIIIGLPAEPPPLVPTLTMLGGTACWGLGQAMIARFGQDEDGMVLLKRTSLHGAIQLSVLTALFESGQIEAMRLADWADWAGLAFIAVVAFALAYVIWYGLLRRNPVSAVAPFIMVIPVATLVTAILFLGERPGPIMLAGGALVLFGVALSSGIIRLPFLRLA